MEVGRVSKEWDNLPKELLATSDNFGVAFPEDIPATHKALLIGVAFILVSMASTDRRLMLVASFGHHIAPLTQCYGTFFSSNDCRRHSWKGERFSR